MSSRIGQKKAEKILHITVCTHVSTGLLHDERDE